MGSHPAQSLASSPASSGIYLQDHGNPVVYRNIWMVPGEGENK